MYFLSVFYAILQLLAILAIGFALRRFGVFSSQFFARLGRFVIRVGLPLYFVAKLRDTDVSMLREAVVLAPLGIVVVAVSVAFSSIVFRAVRLDPADRRAGIALASFGNSGYMPLTLIEILPVTIPVVAEQFGTDISVLFVGAYLLGYSPLLWSVGHFIMTGKGTRPKLSQLITPPIIGIVIGLALPSVGISHFFEDQSLPLYHMMSAIERVSAVTVPLALVCLGSLLADFKVPKGERSRYWTMAAGVVGVRFLVLPALYVGAHFLLDLPKLLSSAHAWVIFLELHTPTATNLSVMAADAGVNRDHAAFTIFLSYLVYLFIMPVYLTLFLRLPGVL